jgi:hypothetical protein
MLLRWFHNHPNVWKSLALVCLLCVAAALTVQVAHFHPDAKHSEQHCTVSALAHLSVTLALFTVALLPLLYLEYLAVRCEKAPPIGLLTFSLSIRPPPAL